MKIKKDDYYLTERNELIEFLEGEGIFSEV